MSQPSFFEFREKLVQAGRQPPALGGGVDSSTLSSAPNALTVSELTTKIDAALRSGLPVSVTVRGEVSNFNHHRGSGHFYFTLKDSSSCIDCVMFRSDAGRVRFAPQDGMELLATGNVRVYAQRGRYQLYVSLLSPLGKGALELALQQLREKLSKEGLFDADRKRPLPAFPRRIAIVTSRQTAALQDVLKVFRRFAFLRLMLFHVPVQGDGAAELIAGAVRAIDGSSAIDRPDVILLARGGGSLEDLWAFNEEIVARAIAACKIPIVTGIGHEVDVSIADLAADYHAHTPTEAAQVIVSRWRSANETISAAANRLRRSLRQMVNEQRHRLAVARKHEFFRRPADIVEVRRQWLDDQQRTLIDALSACTTTAKSRCARLHTLLHTHHPGHALRLARQRLEVTIARMTCATATLKTRRAARLEAIERQLRAVSPIGTLGRGYSITTKKHGGQIVRSAAELKVGDAIVTRFGDGQVESTVRDQKQMRLFE